MVLDDEQIGQPRTLCLDSCPSHGSQQPWRPRGSSFSATLLLYRLFVFLSRCLQSAVLSVSFRS